MIQHRAMPCRKPSGAGSFPVEDSGAGAMLMPRGLWIIIRHGRSIIHKQGSAHSLCRVWQAIVSVFGRLFGAALGLG